jgi:hypothetical protein
MEPKHNGDAADHESDASSAPMPLVQRAPMDWGRDNVVVVPEALVWWSTGVVGVLVQVHTVSHNYY